jgi:HK97 family phage portal protein
MGIFNFIFQNRDRSPLPIIHELESYQPPVFDDPYKHPSEKSFDELKKAEIKSWSVSNGSAIQGFALGLTPSNTGIPVSNLTALGSGPFYAGVNAIANDIAKLPLKLYRKLPAGGSEQVKKHNLLRLLRRPCNWVNAYDLILNTVFNLVLYGNSFIWIDRDVSGQPIRLIPVHYRSCRPQIIPNYGMIYNFTNEFLGQYSNIDFEDMIHLRGVCIDDGIMGLNPIYVNQGVISLDLAVNKHSATMFRQGTILNGTLNSAMTLNEVTAKRMKQSWMDANSGSKNAHGIAILEDGFTFTPISQSAAESQLTDARKLCAIEIARMLGIPQHRIGIMDNATFSNIESQNLSYIDQTLGSICRKIEVEFDSKLLFDNEYDDYYFRFDFNELLRTDTKTRNEANAVGIQNGFLNANEAREMDNRNPREGGDVFTPMLNMTPSQTGTPKPDPAGPDLSISNPPKPKKSKT